MIVITGTGRSGTSALTGAMEACGYQMGFKDDLIGSNWSNEKGNYEAQSLKSFHESILQESTGVLHDWDFFEFPVDPAELEDEYGPTIEKFLDLLNLGDIVKDPRFSFTLPLWKTKANIEKTIYVFRNPLAVAKSINRRDAMDEGLGQDLWLHWVRAFERHTSFDDVIIVEYEKLLQNPAETLEFIGKNLGSNSRPVKAEALGKFVDKKLDHFDAATDKFVNNDVLDVYRNLQKAAEAQLKGMPIATKRGEVSLLSKATPITPEARINILSRWVLDLTNAWRGLRDKNHQNNLISVIEDRERQISGLRSTLIEQNNLMRKMRWEIINSSLVVLILYKLKLNAFYLMERAKVALGINKNKAEKSKYDVDPEIINEDISLESENDYSNFHLHKEKVSKESLINNKRSIENIEKIAFANKQVVENEDKHTENLEEIVKDRERHIDNLNGIIKNKDKRIKYLEKKSKANANKQPDNYVKQ